MKNDSISETPVLLAPADPKPLQDPVIVDLDTSALEIWMKQNVSGFAAPLAVQRFAGGQSNPTYELRSRDQRYVLRSKPGGRLLASAHAIEREYRVMEALGRTSFPVPRTYALCEDTDVIGSAFYVMELVEGRILWDGRLPDAAPAERRAIYEAQVDTLADLHQLDPSILGLADFGRSGNYFARQLARWSRQYAESDGPRYPSMDRLIAWLPQQVPPERQPRIVHGDYRLDNMVLHPSEPHVLAVLDWELSTLGDPMADLTYLLMHWTTPPQERNSLSGLDLDTMGIPPMKAMLDRYLERSGRSLDVPVEWYLAFNLFRFAAILHGVAARGRAGNANNPRAFVAEERVEPLANRAWAFACDLGAGA